MPQDSEMSWRVHSHIARNHSTDWYWGLGLIALLSAAASIFFGNALFAVIIILGAGTVGYLASRPPREHLISLERRGLVLDGTRYPYKSIRSFWVVHEAGEVRLFLSLTGMLTPHLSLYLDSEAQGEDVRRHLLQHVQEEEQGPSLGEHLVELFGL